MRFIKKGDEPKEFKDWKAQTNENWQATYDDLSGDEKKAVFKSLLLEQGHICCYCERKLLSDDFHIEHLNPQCLDVGDDLDYSNFLCSCLRSTEKRDPLHCGKLKGDRIILIHPLQVDCQSKFTYTELGEVDGVDHDSIETIQILGLNINKLINMRKKAVEPFLTDDIDNNEFKSFVMGYITPAVQGERNPFCSMIEFLFKDIVEAG